MNTNTIIFNASGKFCDYDRVFIPEFNKLFSRSIFTYKTTSSITEREFTFYGGFIHELDEDHILNTETKIIEDLIYYVFINLSNIDTKFEYYITLRLTHEEFDYIMDTYENTNNVAKIFYYLMKNNKNNNIYIFKHDISSNNDLHDRQNASKYVYIKNPHKYIKNYMDLENDFINIINNI